MNCNLLIDIGNSSAKYSLATDDKLMEQGRVATDLLTEICDIAAKHDVAKAMVCSVAGAPTELVNKLRELGTETTVLGAETPLPFNIAYKTPLTLGADRIAAMAGAMAQWQEKDMLVVDAGSCITYEFLINGTYAGGNIAPGLEMRLNVMHEHTARLPKADANGDLPYIGYDTDSALRAGALRGIQHEIEGYACQMLEWCEGPVRVVMTGGDAPLIRETLNIEAETDAALVLRGLNYILKYNEQSN